MSFLTRLSLAATLLYACASMAPVAAAQTGLAFDQISIFYYGGSTAAPPAAGAFETLRAAIPAAPIASADYPPAGGQSIPGLAGFARLSQGVLLHESVLGSDMRVDDPATMRATISRRDRNEVIYLDLAAKTYRTITGDAAKLLLDPASSAKLFAQPTPGPAASPDASTETLVVSSAAQPIDGVTIGGIATHGVKDTTAITATQVTGTCPAITTTTTTVRYVDPARDEPATRYDFSDAAKTFKSLPSLSCRFLFGPQATPGPDPDAKHFALYTRTDMQTTVPVLATPIVATMVVSRGNVTALDANAASLFEIPAGFTEAAPDPATPPASAIPALPPGTTN